MGFVVTGGNDEYEKPSAGSVAARCYGIIDLGTQHGEYAGEKYTKHEVMILWELDEKMTDGKPFVVNKRYTASLNEKANLRKDLESWRSRAFTDEELAGFDLSTIIEKPCMLTITLTEKGYAKVVGVSPLPKGLNAPELQNETINFTIDQLGDNDVVSKIYPWVQKIIAESDEGKAFGFVAQEKSGSTFTEQPSTATEGDDVPF